MRGSPWPICRGGGCERGSGTGEEVGGGSRCRAGVCVAAAGLRRSGAGDGFDPICTPGDSGPPCADGDHPCRCHPTDPASPAWRGGSSNHPVGAGLRLRRYPTHRAGGAHLHLHQHGNGGSDDRARGGVLRLYCGAGQRQMHRPRRDGADQGLLRPPRAQL